MSRALSAVVMCGRNQLQFAAQSAAYLADFSNHAFEVPWLT